MKQKSNKPKSQKPKDPELHWIKKQLAWELFGKPVDTFSTEIEQLFKLAMVK